MPDGFDFKFDTRGIKQALKGLDRDIDLATRNGLKSAAAALSKEEKARVPVLSGRLKKSIKQSKVSRKSGLHTFKVNVGPVGNVVKLYRAKINARTHFADDAFEAAKGPMRERFVRAYTNTINKLRG